MKIVFTTIVAAIAVGLIGAGALSSPACAQTADLTKLSLEDLLSTEVSSVAKKPQRVDESAAAVFVVSQDDIRRSGATTIPDILRMVPGMEVAQLPSGGAAVTARGFEGFSANKLLVLVDGRAIYLSSLGGVLWDQQLVPVEDIQRIEIVRGPGATLWGANAVNGVINIVTKHSVDTLGAAVTVQTDTEKGDRLFARFGTQIGKSTTLRVYLSDHALYDHLEAQTGLINDFATGVQGGFRADMEPTDRDAFTLQGDIQSGRNRLEAGSPTVHLPFDSLIAGLPSTEKFAGYNLVTRWTRTLDDRSGFSVQLDGDQVRRNLLGLDGAVGQFNLDFSDHFDLGRRNAIIWGANYNHAWVTTSGTNHVSFSPAVRQDDLFGVYVEDDIAAIPDRLSISVGSKFEHNDQSGFEFEPSVRAIWRGGPTWSIWGAVSRAVRTPSLFENDLTYMSVIEVAPNKDIASEKMVAYEIGWRDEISPGVALDLTAYHQDYDHLISWGSAGRSPGGIPIFQFGNHGHAQNTGLEVALDAAITPKWTIKAAGNLMNLGIDPGGANLVASANSIDQGASPRGQVSIRSLWNLTDAVDFDLWYRHVGNLTTGAIPAYDDLSLHLAWRPTAHVEVSVVGEHLLSAQRVEIRDPDEPLPAIVARQALVKVAVRY